MKLEIQTDVDSQNLLESTCWLQIRLPELFRPHPTNILSGFEQAVYFYFISFYLFVFVIFLSSV